MFVVGHPDRMFLMVAGLPRTGTTIVASFLNSLDEAIVWGEPHRSIGRRGSFPVRTRHATFNFQPRASIPDQINIFADGNNLWLRGFKEVLDTNLKLDPIDLIAKYEHEIDLSLVMIRDPRKTWSSMLAIGHNKGLGISINEFSDLYIQYAEFCYSWDNVIPIILSNFTANPTSYLKKKLDFDISGATKLLQYTGGGDPHTIQDGTIVHIADNRVPYVGDELDDASKLYERIVLEDGC